MKRNEQLLKEVQMNATKWWLTFGMVIVTLSFAYAGDSPGGASPDSSSTIGQGQRTVIGTISKTTDTMLTLKTEEGTTRTFTVKAAAIDGVTKLQPDDRVLLEVDAGNQIIGIHNMGDKHQLVRGEIVGLDQTKKTVTLKLQNGTSQSYGMKEAMAGKMNNIEKGAVVTLMIDPRNTLAMDVQVE
jgi:hypothetical protein